MTSRCFAGFTLIAGIAVGCSGRLERGSTETHVREPMGRGTLVATAEMSASRFAHTATPLQDGRVLVAGGFVESGAPNGAELYEPASGTFSPLPPMVTTRHSHTATRLPGGRVLLAGGYGEGNEPVASAELFDPRTNTFAAAGSLAAPRANHVAVALEGGRVLLVGGVGPGWTFLASAELYDPATDRFSPTGNMAAARESHAAVRLEDGRVLVAGGHNGERRNLTLLTSAEVYDPARGVFAPVGEMGIRRHKHDAVRLPNGHVLISGGADERDNRGVYDSTEMFDPSTGTFTPGPTMQAGRYKHAGSSFLLSSDLVLLAGGAPQAETYDIDTQTFALVPGEPRMAGQFSAAAPLPSGGALVTGGYGNGTGARSSAWLYRP